MEEERDEVRDPLLKREEEEEDEEVALRQRVWSESKKLWRIVGPAIFSRVVTYSMNVITQAFAGHLGDLELASMSIANTVVVGFNFGLMLGMASALETLCGQAYGAKKYHMLGVYMQRSWIVLFFCATLLLPMYLFATPILELLGQPPDLAAQAGMVSMWFIPLHFSFVFLFPIQRFLQCQLKNSIIAIMSAIALIVHLFVSWLFVYHYKFGLVGTALTLDFSWWVAVFLLYGYVAWGGCPHSWRGFSMEAFAGLWEFLKLSAASGVMLCLENWYYRILLLLTGNLKDGKIAVDALSVCMGINGWEMMIPLAFFAGTGVRVANELGAGNGKGARFATIVSVVTSTIIGLFFCILVMVLRDKVALIFTSSQVVLDAVERLSVLLAFTVLLNSVQPILSGVAVGSGWQAMVAYVNIGTYYLIGIPVGVLMGWVFNLGVLGDQASIVGGAINFVKELEQLLQTLETQKHNKSQSSATSPFASFFTFPQYSSSFCEINKNGINTTNNNHNSNTPEVAADIEVTMIESHVNLKVRVKQQRKQLHRLVMGLQSLSLTTLHLNVTTATDQSVLYSFSLKAEDDCQFTSVDEIAAAVYQMVGRIQNENIVCS